MNKLSIHLIEKEVSIFEVALIDDLKKQVVDKLIIKSSNLEDDMKNPENLTFKINQFILGKVKKIAELNIAITSDKIITYPIILPKMNKSELNKAISYELENTFNKYKETYHVTKKIIANTNTNQFICYAILCPNSFIRFGTVLATKLGTSINNISTSGVAAYKFLQKKYDTKKYKNYYILSMFDDFSLFSLIRNGQVINTDIIKNGLEDFNNMVKEHYHVNHEESVLLRNYGKVNDLEITDRERQYIYFCSVRPLVNEIKKIIASNDINYLQEGFDILLFTTYDEDIRLIRQHLKRSFNFMFDSIEDEEKNIFKDQVLLGIASNFFKNETKFSLKRFIFKR